MIFTSKRAARDKRLIVAANMPPLRRTLPGQHYTPANDDVIKWLSQRPGLMSYLFDKVANAGYIVYDSETGTWQGVDYAPEDNDT